MQRLLLRTVLFSFIVGNLWAQKPEIVSKVGGMFSTENTPFLLRSNQFGVVPLESNILYINTRLKRDYDSTKIGKKFFDYGYGIEPHLNVGKSTEFLLPEIYAKAKLGIFEVYAGRRREVFGIVDKEGSMGSFIWSGNSLPVPKVDISIPEYTSLGKGKLLAVKGNFAHGWLGSGDSVKNVLLHQKSLYLKLGKPNWKIKVIGGMNHQVQWGGRPAVPFVDQISNQLIDKYNTDLQTYWRVINGTSVSGATGIPWDSLAGVPANEAGNRFGNHLGSVDVGIELDFKDLNILIYRQSFFEDGSLFYLNNIHDGLTGISFTPKSGSVKKITFEYLYTANQGGPIYYGNIPELRGVDNYFNNGIYKDAWTYRGKTIGSPLLNPYRENPEVFGDINKPNQNYIFNNRVKAFSIKTLYSVGGIQLATHVLSSTNMGTYSRSLDDLKQFSFLQRALFGWMGYEFSTGLAFDSGKYWQNSFGLDIGVIKRWR